MQEWDKNAAGNIIFAPLADYSIAVLAGMGCGLRLRLARPGETQQTASHIVQVAMTAEQAQGLVTDLHSMIDRIHAPQTEGSPH